MVCTSREMVELIIFDLKLFLLLYADDAVIFSETIEGLQNALNYMSTYCDKWRLTLNSEKTKIVIFRKGSRVSKKEKWVYKGNALEVVNCFKYLGIVLACGGSNHITQKTLSVQAKKACFGLLKNVNDFSNMPVTVLCDLFDKTILPILNYGCELWGFGKADDIERVHLWFCKVILKVKSSTVNEMVYGEVGRHPVFIDRNLQILRYWFKILKSPDDRLIKHVYAGMCRRCENGNDDKNWSWHVKNLLFTYGFGHVWVNQGVGDEQAFYKCFLQRQKDMYQQSFTEKVNGYSKTRLYRHIYEIYQIPFYIECVYNIRYRQAITKLRTCNHRLYSETGRWRRPPVPFDERICSLCDVLEDEYHFVLICGKFTTLRRKYIQKYYYTRPSMEKFVSLLNSKKKRQIHNLGIFLYKAFKEM